MILRRGRDERWDKAYCALREMLEGKNYFIVSLCMDDYIYGARFDEAKVAAACGGFRMMQCDKTVRGN